MSPDGSRLYAVGDFTSVGGVARTLEGLAETHDPDNNDAAYRTAAVTAWGKKAAPQPGGAASP